MRTVVGGGRDTHDGHENSPILVFFSNLLERFTRVGPDAIDYTFSLEDPQFFTRAWTAAAPMTTDHESRGVTSGPIWEYACHEGNHAMINILAGARAEEAAAKQQR